MSEKLVELIKNSNMKIDNFNIVQLHGKKLNVSLNNDDKLKENLDLLFKLYNIE